MPSPRLNFPAYERLLRQLCGGLVAGVVWFAIVITACESKLSAADPAVFAAQESRQQVVKQVAPAVVAIFANGGQGGGSGVLISPDGYALSNFHVTVGAGDFMKCGLNDGVLYDAVIVGIDPTGDVALVKLLGRDDFPHVKLGDSDKVRVGDWSYAMGNPFLLATDFHPTVTLGIVSGVHRYQAPSGTFLEYTDCIQVDTSINPGNSGGPLFNAAGELIGINGRISFVNRVRVNSGVGYAISINQIKLFLDHLKSGRIVDHATLGATVRTGDNRAVVVDSILELSEAFRRGLREGDEIVSFGNRPVGSVNQFKNILGIYPKGWRLPLVYRRDGRKQEILVELRGLHRESELVPEMPKGPQPDRKPPAPNEKNPPKIEKPAGEEEAKPPEQFKHLFEKKKGYANWYFNKLQQERVLKGLRSWGDYAAVAGRWKCTGTFTREVPFQLTMSDQGVGLFLGQLPFLQPLEAGAGEAFDEPPGSGGLLMAFHQWKLLLTKGPKAFTDFYYFGSVSLDGREELVDVLISLKGGVETRWYFRQSDQQFIGFDATIASDVDAAQVRFGELREVDGRQFPKQFTVSCGGRELGQFTVNLLECLPPSAMPTPEKPTKPADTPKD